MIASGNLWWFQVPGWIVNSIYGILGEFGNYLGSAIQSIAGGIYNLIVHGFIIGWFMFGGFIWGLENQAKKGYYVGYLKDVYKVKGWLKNYTGGISLTGEFLCTTPTETMYDTAPAFLFLFMTGVFISLLIIAIALIISIIFWKGLDIM